MGGRRTPILASAGLLGLAAAGFGSSAGYGCTNSTCKATFHGTGSQDRSGPLGPRAEVSVKRIDTGAADVSAEGRSRTLGVGSPAQMGPLRLTLQRADGDSATLRIVKTG